mgnify:CR=1 FL=1
MYETKLMATEEQACLTQRMEWSQAVHVIEKVLDQYLYDPEPVIEDHESEVLGAWQRILQG